MKYQFTVTIDTGSPYLAGKVRDEAAGAIEGFIENSRPDFNISVGGLTELGGPNEQAAIEAAREEHGSDGTLEIDDNATVSFSSDRGAYVGAWVWVSDESVVAKGGINPETAEEGEGG
jgi:8-oxo-dGTP pyrophosphatase MutT (NUDIX family)